jgi:hypothetical protein
MKIIKCENFKVFALDDDLLFNCFIKPTSDGYVVLSRIVTLRNGKPRRYYRSSEYLQYSLDENMNITKKELIKLPTVNRGVMDIRLFSDRISFGNKDCNCVFIESKSNKKYFLRGMKNVIYHDGHYIDFFKTKIWGKREFGIKNIPYEKYRGGTNIIDYDEFLLCSVHETVFPEENKRIYEQYILVMNKKYEVLKEIFVDTTDCIICEVNNPPSLRRKIRIHRNDLVKVVFPMSMWLEGGELKICCGINDQENIIQTFDVGDIVSQKT